MSITSIERALIAAAATMRTGMTIAEAPTGRILFRNAEADRIFGDLPLFASKEEYEQFGCFHADGTALMNERRPLVRALGGEVVLGERIEIARDGVQHTIRVHATPIRDEEGKIIAAVSTYDDITEARRAHDDATRLQRLSERLSTTVTERDVAKVLVEDGCEAVGAAIGILWQLRGDALHIVSAKQHRILDSVNDFATLALSTRFPICDVVRTCNPLSFGSFDEMLRAYPELSRSPEAPTFEARMVMPLIVAGHAVGAVSFAFDRVRTFSAKDHALLRAMIGQVSIALERARLFEAVREREDRLGVALSAARAGTWTVDLKTMRSTRDPSYHALTARTEMSVDADFEDIHPDDRPIARAAFERSLRERVPYEPEVRIRKSDGGHMWVRAHGRLVFENGEPIALAGVIVDIDDAKRASLEAEERARVAERRKDEFLAMLGHELRNPLAPIITALALMERDGSGAFERERAVIRRQVDHLGRLVDDLLDVSRITRGKIALVKHRVEIGTIIAQAIETASPLFEQRRHRVSVDVPSEGLVVDADPTRLAQIFQNLLVNAGKYSDDGGAITIVARREGERVVVSVADRGIGIFPELLPRVFDLFVQGERALDRATGGLGIGLGVAKSLCELHGGTIEAASEGPGRGSTFTVTLPLAQGPSDVAEERGRAPLKPVARTRVLVVDDNIDAAEMLDGYLTSLGHETAVAYDAAAALDVATRFAPDVAVLDIGLPVMDGYELARKLRSMLARNIRLIAVTGYGQPEDRARAREAGFDHHLVKPVELESLASLLA